MHFSGRTADLPNKKLKMITREVLLAMVNGKVDTTKFKSLSQKTINEELDDVLEDLGDDDDANDKIVTKLANRLKRMDGNVHKSVSDEMKKNRDAEEERKRLEEEERKRRERAGDKPGEETGDAKYKSLEEKLNKLLAANEERDKKAARSAVIESVKRGLKDKFDKAELELNDFFLETALGKLEIPEENADVLDLVSKAEGIYTADYKRANGGSAVPKKGQPSSTASSEEDDEFMKEIVERRKKRFGDQDAK